MNPYKQKNIKIKEIKITQRKTLCVVIPECFYQGSRVFVFIFQLAAGTEDSFHPP